VSIVQEGFVPDAKASGEAFRIPDPVLAVTPHVFTALNAPQTRRAVDAIIDDIVNGLTTPLPEPEQRMVGRITTRGPKDEVLEFAAADRYDAFLKMNEAFLEWGWSDGFPIICPTEEAVREMLSGTKRDPDDTVVEHFVPGMARGSVRSIAINAVMAGCRPELLPVVIAAVEAMHDPAIATRNMAMSTSPHAPLFIVNGPIADRLQINHGLCALGPAGPEKLSFPNVAIGRAVRLSLMNIGNCYPGIMDQDTIGSPAKFGMVLAENVKANPWQPYHVEKGWREDESTISCCYGHSLIDMCDMESDTAAGLMNTFAKHLTGIGGQTLTYYKPVILLAPDHAAVLARDGWTKEDIRQYLHLHCRIPAEQYRRSACGCYPVPRKWLDAADSRAMIPLYEHPADFQIVVVGGMAGKSAAYGAYYAANPYRIDG
jgi:hypothetical protein